MIETIKIAYGDHASQFGVLRLPDTPRDSPVIITIHGGFWQSKYDLDENNPLTEDLTQRGYATWNIEYRRVGEECGGWPGTFIDVISGVNHLIHLKKQFQLDLTSVIILGHSAGGQLALWLASRNNQLSLDGINKELLVPLKAVISLAGVVDLKKMWEIHAEKGDFNPVSGFLEGIPQEVPDRYASASPIELLPLNVKQILIHGKMDKHVPHELSKMYYKKAQKLDEGIRLFILPDTEHFMVIDPSSHAWKTVIEALESIRH